MKKTGRAIRLDMSYRNSKVVTLSQGTSASALTRNVCPQTTKKSPCPLTRPTSLEMLKNSLAELPPKMHRVRMLYKRFSPISDTFLVTPFGSVFRQIEFFNSHAWLQQLFPNSERYKAKMKLPTYGAFWQALEHRKNRPFTFSRHFRPCRSSRKRCGTRPAKPTAGHEWKTGRTAAPAAVFETSPRYVQE